MPIIALTPCICDNFSVNITKNGGDFCCAFSEASITVSLNVCIFLLFKDGAPQMDNCIFYLLSRMAAACRMPQPYGLFLLLGHKHIKFIIFNKLFNIIRCD